MIEPIGNQPAQPPASYSDCNTFQQILTSGVKDAVANYVNQVPDPGWAPRDLLSGILQAIQPYAAVIGGTFNATLQQLQTDFNNNNYTGVNNDFQALVNIKFNNISDADFQTATANALGNFQTMVSENNNQAQVEGFYNYVFGQLVPVNPHTSTPLRQALTSATDPIRPAFSNYMYYQGTPPPDLQNELVTQIGALIPLASS